MLLWRDCLYLDGEGLRPYLARVACEMNDGGLKSSSTFLYQSRASWVMASMPSQLLCAVGPATSRSEVISRRYRSAVAVDSLLVGVKEQEQNE